MPSIDVPSNVQRPWSDSSKPVIRLKKVVLPVPLGPMRAVISPRWTSAWSTSTATSPPKARRTLSAMRIGSVFGTPGRLAAGTATARSADIEGLFPAIAEDPLRPEHHERSQCEPGHDVLHLAEVVRCHEPIGQLVVAGGLAEEVVDELDHKEKDHGADEGPLDPPHPAEHDNREGKEREGRRVAPGLRRLQLGGQQETADGADEAAEHEALHLERQHVLAQRPGRVLVLADALEHPAPRTAHQRPHEQSEQGHETPAEDQHEQPVAVDRLLAEVVHAVVGERVEVLKELRPTVLAVA